VFGGLCASRERPKRIEKIGRRVFGWNPGGWGWTVERGGQERPKWVTGGEQENDAAPQQEEAGKGEKRHGIQIDGTNWWQKFYLPPGFP